MSRDFITNIYITEGELRKLLSDLLDESPEVASDFFARFNFGPLYYGGRFFETLERGHEILHLCARINPDAYEKIHKGLPLYWMGMAAYRIHDFQSALYYIDATLSEDLKNFPSSMDTPPKLFLCLDGEADKQTAKPLVQGAQQSIEEYISIYNQLLSQCNLEVPSLSLEDLRTGFLS